MNCLALFILITGIFGLIYGAFYAVIALVGLIKKKPSIPFHAPEKHIAVLIPARNEEAVVPFLIDSLQKQTYPKSLYEIIVIPNNCTDNTERAAKNAGARVMKVGDGMRSKGEVLRRAFLKLEKEAFDGYVVLDADNVVDENFLQAANNTLCAGYEVGQARRESKNPYASWVACCTSIFFWFMNSLFNRSRAALGMSASLNGTGVLFSRKIIAQTGYAVETLTEDLEYTAICALNDCKIAYMEDAVTYDEQPVSLRDSFTQRRRWSAGSFQCFKKFAGQLFKKRTLQAFDNLMLFSAIVTQVVALVPIVYAIFRFIRNIVVHNNWAATFYALFSAIAGMFLTGLTFAIIVAFASGNFSRKLFPQSLLMGFYLFTWMPANLLCLVTKPPKWTQIPHTFESSIADAASENEG